MRTRSAQETWIFFPWCMWKTWAISLRYFVRLQATKGLMIFLFLALVYKAQEMKHPPTGIISSWIQKSMQDFHKNKIKFKCMLRKKKLIERNSSGNYICARARLCFYRTARTKERGAVEKAEKQVQVCYSI